MSSMESPPGSLSLKTSECKTKPKAASPNRSRRNALPLFGPGSDETLALLRDIRPILQSEQLEPTVDLKQSLSGFYHPQNMSPNSRHHTPWLSGIYEFS